VLREALTNIARHAHATEAAILISVNRASIVVDVRDNGRGMGRSTRRSGLANLRTRAERRHGNLVINSDPASGTRLVWSIPSSEATGEIPVSRP
jgi:signal transduction histidine kinase